MKTLLDRLCYIAVLSVTALHAGEFKVGSASVVITPPDGTPMAGFYSFRGSSGVIDDLCAKAIVVEQDGAKAAFVVLDLSGTTRAVVAAARKLIAEQCGIPPERVLISATHTHSGPVQLRDNLMDDITGAKLPLAQEFGNKLPLQIARAVAEAHAKLVPALASAGMGREEHLSFNRRSWMKDGTVAWMPKLNPNIVRPAGPIDPDVGVLYFAASSKKSVPLAAYVNFAMHATAVGGSKICADYPGALCQRMGEFLGPQLVTLFANGCCGNINQIDPQWAAQPHGVTEASRIGTVLAAAVFEVWPQLQPLHTFAPRVRSVQVVLPRRQVSEEEVAAARSLAERFGKEKLATPVMANAVCVLDTQQHKDTPLEAEVQVIAFSDEIAIVALPGEIFVELGLAIKQASPFKRTFIAELANGSIGYIPNRAAYPEGQYEIVSARCAAGSGEMLVDAAVRLLNEVAKP